jgi:polyhydroxybutyrate depolymerase
MGDALRSRLLARAGLTLPALPVHSIEVGGIARTFAAAPGPSPDAPLLLVLHGAGGTGLGMAALTDLHRRGPAAGCAVMFPDGVAHVWNDERSAPRLKRREGVDDVAFMRALVDHARRTGLSDGRRVFAVGISNGGLLAEHLARHGLLELAGIALVAASATERSRAASPVPQQRSRFVAFHGTADTLVPYTGGPIALLGRLARARPELAPRGTAAPIEQVSADWSFAIGPARPAPTVETVLRGPLPVQRLRWHAGPAPDVGTTPTLYRVVGGGHTWPGGAQYLPARIVGPVARELDATGDLLDFVWE